DASGFKPVMPARVKRTAASFLAVLAAFGVYRVAAEPFIEPEVEEFRAPTSTFEAREQARAQLDGRLRDYVQYFPEGAWERDSPIVLESSNAKLLLREYQNQPDGTVRLLPCTVIFLPEGEVDE